MELKELDGRMDGRQIPTRKIAASTWSVVDNDTYGRLLALFSWYYKL